MEKYRVLENFKDFEDNEHIYLKNCEGKNIYPREGLEPTKKRIKELSSKNNKIGKVLIQKIEEEEEEQEEKPTKNINTETAE